MSVVNTEQNIQDNSINLSHLEKLTKYIKETDSDEKLSNFCYVPNMEQDENFKQNEHIIKNCRGVVFDKETSKIVLRAYNYTPEYSAYGTDFIKEFVDIGGGVKVEEGNNDIPAINRGFEQCSFFESHEGALIRMFFHDKWYITTHRKLNAFKSIWSGKTSYGTSFKNALKYQIENNDELKQTINNSEGYLEGFQDTLDKNNSYMFLVKNIKENKLVCKPSEHPELYHVGTFLKDGNLDMEYDVKIPKPKKIDLKNIDDLYNYVNNSDPNVTPGVIVFCPGNKQFKVSSPAYIHFLNVRGNQSSVKFRYLQVRDSQELVNDLCYLYPEFQQAFEKYEDILKNDVTTFIHNAYIKRFIKHQFVKIPPAEYLVLSLAHEWYLSDKSNRKVTKNIIYDFINQQNPVTLNQMIKHVLYPQNVKPNKENSLKKLQDKIDNMQIEETDKMKIDD